LGKSRKSKPHGYNGSFFRAGCGAKFLIGHLRIGGWRCIAIRFIIMLDPGFAFSTASGFCGKTIK
jgi:hypothetical protein